MAMAFTAAAALLAVAAEEEEVLNGRMDLRNGAMAMAPVPMAAAVAFAAPVPPPPMLLRACRPRWKRCGLPKGGLPCGGCASIDVETLKA